MRSPREIKEEEIPVNISEGHVRSSVVSQFDQEAGPDVSHQQVKEEEIPVNISEGLHSGSMDAVSVIKEEEDERNDQDIHQVEICSDPFAGLRDEHLDTLSVIKEEEDERDEKDIVQVTIDSDICDGHVSCSVVSQFDQEAEPDVRSHQQFKEEEIPVNTSEAASIAIFMSAHVVVKAMTPNVVLQ
ncbi:uncharacterized protein O3C94_016519 [Discoglossus pictus]